MTRIRPAEPAEFAAIGDLTSRGFASGPYSDQITPEREAIQQDASVRARDGDLLVAVSDDGALVGTVSLVRPGTPSSRLAVDGELEARFLAVDPAAQRSGAGAALMREAVEFARGRGARAIVLDTGERNVPASRLYERLGFERVPERETVHTVVPVRVYRRGFEVPEGVVIRWAREDELLDVGALALAAYRADYDVNDGYALALADAASNAAVGQVWVAVDAAHDHLLGSMWTPLPGERLSVIAREGEMDFRQLAVSPDARGGGVGAALVTHALALGRDRGVDRVVLSSGPEMLGAHRLYEKLGFSRLSEREGDVEVAPGRIVRLFAFGLDLG